MGKQEEIGLCRGTTLITVNLSNYPTVAVGEERLRFAPTPLHTDAMIDECVRAVAQCLK